MNFFAELKSNVDSFKGAREAVIETAELPPTDLNVNFGKPPFAIDDGTYFYAVIDRDGDISPLPFGYSLRDENIEDDGADAIFSAPCLSAEGGMDVVRYIPLVEDFEIPSKRAFCLESVEDSEVWAAVGDVLESMQEVINEQVVFNFYQKMSSAVVAFYGQTEELDSVDQAVTAMFFDSSVLPLFLVQSYKLAAQNIEADLLEGEGE